MVRRQVEQSDLQAGFVQLEATHSVDAREMKKRLSPIMPIAPKR